jgi:ABC-type polysaccharide/polyol phosphate transport system ATPase subunit
MSEEILKIKNISKIFKTNFKYNKELLENLVNFRTKKEKIVALKNFSLTAKKGENIGIIGGNGSGKSTLLKMIAGILEPDEGTIERNGLAIYVSGYSTVFKPQLTGLENIELLAAHTNVPKKEMEKLKRKIMEMSGLGNDLYRQIGTYSSGMYARLSFSTIMAITSYMKPEIYLFDEILSGGGDNQFVEKTKKIIDEIFESDALVLIASHRIDELNQKCDKVIELGSVYKS